MKILQRNTRRVSTAFAYLLVALTLLGSISVYAVTEQYAGVRNIYRHPLAVSNAVRDIRIEVLSIDRQMHNLRPGITGPELKRATSRIMIAEAKILRLFDRVQARFLGNRKSVIDARQAFLAWQPMRREVLRRLRQGGGEAYRRINAENLQVLDHLSVQLAVLTNFAAGKARSFRTQAERHLRSSLWIIGGLASLLFASAIAIAIFTIRSLHHSQRIVSRNLDLLQESKDRYLKLLDAAPDGIVIADGDGRIQMSNRRLEEMFGHSTETLQGAPVETLVPDSLRQHHRQSVGQYLNAPAARQMNQGRRVEGRRRDGTVFPASVSLNPVRIGEELLVTASVRDISEELRLEERLLHVRKMEGIGTLVGGIAHEFNNILAGFVGNLYLLRQRHEDECSRKYIRNMESAASKATRIVQQLMAFAGRGMVNMRAIELSSLVRRMLESHQFPQGVEIVRDVEAAPCCVQGDVELLEQAVAGLLENAADAVREVEHPFISISLRRVDGEGLREAYPELTASAYACLSVQDNGIGIPESEIDKLFDPFFTTKEVGEGTGLGLAMIHGIVASHGGEITVESEKDKNTCASLYLPCVEAASEKAEAGGA